MIDIQKSEVAFNNYLDLYKNFKEDVGFKTKVTHTYHVVENSRELAKKISLDDENIALAELIALLHDIGRFEELKVLNLFDGTKFDHAEYGVKLLFEDNLIYNFTNETKYYTIIKNAIFNHNKLKIQDNLNDDSLLHSRIIRDSDKLDNFRIETEITPEKHFVRIVNSIRDFENSTISDIVFNSIQNHECIKLVDRHTPLDYYICLLGFIFDIYFKESFKKIQDKNYINLMIDKIDYKLPETKERMNTIKQILNSYIKNKLESYEV